MILTEDELLAMPQPPFAQLLGIRILSASAEEVVGEVVVTEALTNRSGMLHGGAIMTIADNVAGTATQMYLRPDQNTVTSESKTNFFRPFHPGDRVRAVARCLHGGRRMMVWQTSLYRGDGKMGAQVTQTQMIVPRNKDE